MQISPINSQINSSKPNRKSNPNFSGTLNMPVAGEIHKLIDNHPILCLATNMFDDVVRFCTSPTLEVTMRDISESEAKLVQASTARSKFDRVKENMVMFYNDTKTGVNGKIGFYLNPHEARAETTSDNLTNTLKDVARGSFIG